MEGGSSPRRQMNESEAQMAECPPLASSITLPRGASSVKWNPVIGRNGDGDGSPDELPFPRVPSSSPQVPRLERETVGVLLDSPDG